MARRKGVATEGQPDGTRRVFKRRPRKGPKRVLALSLLTDDALWLEMRATRQLTTPAEIVMDLIAEARKRRGEAVGAVAPDDDDRAAA